TTLQDYSNDYVSNIRIDDNYVLMNSTSEKTISCRKFQPDGKFFNISTSRIIDSNLLKIYIEILNSTLAMIHLKSNGYLGIFNLNCFSTGEEKYGDTADVIIGG
ncbi:unnamed protein product, partial [Didymodactylos carnosus]